MLKPGDLVGPYEIRGFVGQGGMGQVYRAFDPRLERTVALKVIVVPEKTDDNDSARVAGEFSARLLREARAVASLSHPNVVGVFDVGEHDGRLYLAMEYVVGSTLRSFTGRKRRDALRESEREREGPPAPDDVGADEIPLARKLRWLADVARALEVAHKNGLVHRDVKPENVMVREDGLVKVLDFGIARRTMQAGADSRGEDTVTGGGAIAGTPVYMAPEQIRGNEVDARCDQFAWGVMAYELLAGERPWSDAGDVLAVVARVLTDPPPSLRARVGTVPGAVEETILRTLSKEPGQRFPSMADVADAIEPFAMQTSGGGDRIRITAPDQTHADGRDGPSAFAATTRVPTSVSLGPSPSSPPSKRDPAEAEARKRKRARKRTLRQLALPVALLGGLAMTVYAVRTKMSLQSLRNGTGIGAVPTSSGARPMSQVPEADASYREALRLWHDGVTSKSREALRRAIELDPGFAAAHLELAIQSVQDDPSAAQASFQNAFEHRHMLPVRESDLLEASEPYVRPQPDLEEWETRLTTAVFRHPRDAELHFFLGRARERQGDDEGAKGAFEDALKIDRDFVPAIAALANVERSLGHVAEALAATDRCLARSPVAATCRETRYRVFADEGDCHRAREEAAQWRSLEPQSPASHAGLARALFGDGAPRPSVEEALGRAWALAPPLKRTTTELRDRMYLAIVDGDLVKAETLASDYEAALPPSADQWDHAQPARARGNVLYEAGDVTGAAKVAKAYLDHMDAWTPFPFAPDQSIGFYEPLYRSGQLTKRELDDKRTKWVEGEKVRLSGSDRSVRAKWGVWTLWGSFAETREEALEAIRHLPAVALPLGSRRALTLDFALGKVYALAGEPSKAVPHLLRVTKTCTTFEDALPVLRSHFYLGTAYEALGEREKARAELQQVVSSWPKETKSRTIRAAEQRLASLPAAPAR